MLPNGKNHLNIGQKPSVKGFSDQFLSYEIRCGL